MKRREFIKSSALAGGSLLSPPGLSAHASESASGLQAPIPSMPLTKTVALNLRPARWIWYPSERTLQNTVVLFRRQLDLPEKPLRAKGWVVADGRYRLEVNGQRVQWGPAPCDPRWLEVDPMDLTELLHAGANTLGAQVLFFGQGDGTWPIGKCGFIFWLEIETAHGEKQTIVSDEAWQAYLARSWKPGHYKRWYLRALQEEFDARLFPYGWTSPGFTPNQDWLPAMPLECPADKPAICSTYPEYMLNFRGDPDTSQLRARSIPLMRETLVPAARLAESCWIEWDRSPEEYFEFMPPNSFRPDRKPSATEGAAGSWDVELDGRRGAALTFEFAEQMVGWPYFTIEAPAGTTIEMMVQEAHQVGGPALLNTHFHSWTRFICREGINHFETFDFECCRWVQLHVHGASGKVTISNVGMRRRVFPWPHSPAMRVSEPPLQPSNTRLPARPASRRATAPSFTTRQHSSGVGPRSKCRANKFSFPAGNTVRGSPGTVRLTSSVAWPSPPTAIRARRQPLLNRRLASPATSSRFVRTATSRRSWRRSWTRRSQPDPWWTLPPPSG